MAEKHLIVFGEQAEQQLKRHLSKIKFYKEAQWLYDGLLYGNEDSSENLVQIVFKDPKFAPNAIIDNTKWISPELFGKNQKIWQEAIKQCFAMTARDQIHCFTYGD